MIKSTANAEEIRSEILRRIQACDDLGEAYSCCDIALPQAANPQMNNGCKWRVTSVSGVPSECLLTVRAIMAEVMREFDLAPSGK